ncbi:hypothetical protein QYE76_026026 [Lolium multiflorum]|uniref:Uncharacterized protein n=1 Tax=Lolium multiflorum TaxID=4521 RepID=A0AAD8VV66_LOLMU|nr:hypothetical protein QYE76_026026 [Lolium multiflorum]
MHYPPWRKPEYMRANWLSSDDKAPTGAAQLPDTVGATAVSAASFSGEFELSVPRAQRRRPRLVHPQHRRTSTTAWDSSFHGRLNQNQKIQSKDTKQGEANGERNRENKYSAQSPRCKTSKKKMDSSTWSSTGKKKAAAVVLEDAAGGSGWWDVETEVGNG